jgi:hypothetical protein
MIDESDSQREKYFDSRISTCLGISISDDSEKFRINLRSKTLIRNPLSRTKMSFSDSIEIDHRITSINAEPLMNKTFRGTTLD